jgi:hypothetical protein
MFFLLFGRHHCSWEKEGFFFLIFFSLNSIEKHKKEEDKLRREKAFLRIKKKNSSLLRVLMLKREKVEAK